MPSRYTKSSIKLVTLLRTASNAIGAEPNWPTAAPTAAEVAALSDALQQARLEVEQAEGALAVARKDQRNLVQDAQTLIRRLDDATDLLYGRRGAQKHSFGLKPYGSNRQEELKRVTKLKLRGGTELGSVFMDWGAIEGASYEVRWYRDDSYQDLAGSGVATKSAYQVEGLTAGEKYWFSVRAVRGGKAGPWSGNTKFIVPM